MGQYLKRTPTLPWSRWAVDLLHPTPGQSSDGDIFNTRIRVREPTHDDTIIVARIDTFCRVNRMCCTSCIGVIGQWCGACRAGSRHPCDQFCRRQEPFVCPHR